MKITIITLFPDVIEPYLASSIMKKAQEVRAVSFSVVPLRPFGLGKYKQVDDAPYGGGRGMVLRPEPVFAAVDHITQLEGKKPRTLVMTPRGKRFTEDDARRLSQMEQLLFIAGHYEGIDERVSIELADEEVSIGDYVLTGGELPALVVVDAVVRLLKGVLPDESTREESFSENLLEYPQYTRPPEFRGLQVPEILRSGDHKAIETWRKKESERRTVSRSPDSI